MRRSNDAPLNKTTISLTTQDESKKSKESESLDYYNMARAVNMEVMYNACRMQGRNDWTKAGAPSMRDRGGRGWVSRSTATST